MISHLCFENELFLKRLLVKVRVQTVDSTCESDTARLWIQHKKVSVKAVDSVN